MKEKRASADLIPYRKEGGRWFFYLQKRDANAERAPNKISLFGGGTESDEMPEETLSREMLEELNYTPRNPLYFSKYELPRIIAHIFLEEVGPAFESEVNVQEGEYGLFLTHEEVLAHPEVTPFAKLVVSHVHEFLSQ